MHIVASGTVQAAAGQATIDSRNDARRQGEGSSVAPYRPPAVGHARRRYNGTAGAIPRALCERTLEALAPHQRPSTGVYGRAGAVADQRAPGISSPGADGYRWSSSSIRLSGIPPYSRLTEPSLCPVIASCTSSGMPT